MDSIRKKIVILLHEQDSYPAERGHFIWKLCDLWREAGHTIEIAKGPAQIPGADLLIPHIDLTVLPPAYVEALGKFSRVVNRRVRDISKRLISQNLVTNQDSYDGPVIVKTDLNFGGAPEARLANPSLAKRKKSWRERFGFEKDWVTVRQLNPTEYPIFPSLAKVPKGVFANESLVIEKFLPEQENGLFHLRIYQFFGDRDYCVRLGSKKPIVKAQTIVTREEVAVPDEIVATRRELGLDYGKMDFVIRNGRVILFDVNRTPGSIRPEERMQASAQRLAPGLESYF